MEGDGERRAVGCEQADHIADADAASRECAGERVDLLDHLAIGGLGAGLGVDQGDPVEVGVVDAGEEVLVDAGGRDVDLWERAREAHGPDRTISERTRGQTSSSCRISFFGATIRNDASISSLTSSQSIFFLAVRSRPSQPDGPM